MKSLSPNSHVLQEIKSVSQERSILFSNASLESLITAITSNSRRNQSEKLLFCLIFQPKCKLILHQSWEVKAPTNQPSNLLLVCSAMSEHWLIVRETFDHLKLVKCLVDMASRQSWLKYSHNHFENFAKNHNRLSPLMKIHFIIDSNIRHFA